MPPAPARTVTPAAFEQAAHALAVDVTAEERVQHDGPAEAGESERLAGRGAADGLVLVERELHVRHRLGQAVEVDDAVPRGGARDEDVVGHVDHSGGWRNYPAGRWASCP